jgi:hypothetical protein
LLFQFGITLTSLFKLTLILIPFGNLSTYLKSL